MISPPGVLDRMIRGIRRLCSRRQTDDSDLKKRPEIFSGLSDLCIRNIVFYGNWNYSASDAAVF